MAGDCGTGERECAGPWKTKGGSAGGEGAGLSEGTACSSAITRLNSGRVEGLPKHLAIRRSSWRGVASGGGSRSPSTATFRASSLRAIPSKGTLAVHSSQQTTPKLHTSHLWLYVSPRRTSGAAHCTEPTRVIAPGCMHSRDRPKSATFTEWSEATSRFWLLRSRWMIAGSQRCRYSIPRAVSARKRSARRHGGGTGGFRACKRAKTEPSGRKSVTIARVPLRAMHMPSKPSTLGWSSRCISPTSLQNDCSICDSFGRTRSCFTAT
mmetsp:Transcript_44519/g.102097  ORF Transcript_44519/g.102097 Transcript_44519/m.102097 type:complete len:266 (+) Transcript_44519:647-1444(+)